ncbi:MAG: protein kinase [Clostridia bacterium]|nr:protein kinase [Clostridia bacterium]
MLKLEERIRKYEPLFGQWYLGKKIERLGRGNSGTVFAIHKDQYDSAHKRVIATLNYALKVVPIPKNDEQLNELRKKCHSEEEVKQRLRAEKELAQKEIDIMERLWSAKSNNIVFFENNHIREREDTFGWDVLICMERLERLDKLLENYKAYKLEKPGYDLYMRIWSELLDGLHACESQNIVHLDIKPENIFYGPPGLNRFKLGDFGVSAKTETDGLAEVGMRVGTIEYMAPEVYKGAGGDTRSDMYSLALVIYQLMNNNRLPFQSMGVVTREDNMQASQTRIEGLTPIPRINGVDPATMAILLKCLEPDPRNRFQTVAECKQALMQVVGSRRKHGKLLPMLIAGAAVLVVGIAAFVGISMFGGSGENDADGVVPSVIELPVGEIPGEAEGLLMNVRQNFKLVNGRASVQDKQLVYSGDGLAEGDVITVRLNGMKHDEIRAIEDGKWVYVVDKSTLPQGICSFDFSCNDGRVSAQPFIYDTAIEQPVIWNYPFEGCGVVSGFAEPNSIVAISGSSIDSINTGHVSTCTTDENGWFMLDVSGLQLREGDRLLLQCSDFSGNKAKPVSCTVGPASERQRIAVNNAQTGGIPGGTTLIKGIAEPRSRLVVWDSSGERQIDVDPSGNFVAEVYVATEAQESMATLRYEDSDEIQQMIRIVQDNGCMAFVRQLPTEQRPVMRIECDPGAQCAISVDSSAYVECMASEDGIADVDLSGCGLTSDSEITVVVTDRNGNQTFCAVRANTRDDSMGIDINSIVAVSPETTSDIADDISVTAEPTEEPEAQRKDIELSYSFDMTEGFNQPEGHVPGSFRVHVKGEPSEYLKVQISCSFLKDIEEKDMRVDGYGDSVIARSYASEGRVTVRVWYADQPQHEAKEISLMIDGKAPELFIGEVTEGAQMLTGTSEPGAKIVLSAPGTELSTAVNADGQFILPMNDYSADVTYTLVATDESGNSSKLNFKPAEAELVYDPARNVAVTNIKQSSQGGASGMVTVTASGSGTTGREIAVFVNGVHQINVKPGNDGKWVATLMMPASENEYDIKAMYVD